MMQEIELNSRLPVPVTVAAPIALLPSKSLLPPKLVSCTAFDKADVTTLASFQELPLQESALLMQGACYYESTNT